jgi:hypothetical protein
MHGPIALTAIGTGVLVREHLAADGDELAPPGCIRVVFGPSGTWEARVVIQQR